MKFAISATLASFFLVPTLASAQTATSSIDEGYLARAVVLQIVSSSLAYDSTSTPQTHNDIVKARISSGNEKGKVIEFSTYYTDGDGQKLNPGELIYVTRYQVPGNGDPIVIYSYSSLDHDRLPIVILFLMLFVGCIVYFGGKQGMRGLISLVGGLCFIVFLLLPGVVHGYPPLLMSVIVAAFFATIGAYITHGFSRMTSAAILGMITTIVGTALLAQLAVHFGHLSGITDENSYYMLTDPYAKAVINFQGLLLGGIIIGILGVLYDAAIGQSVSVEELARVGPHLSRSVIYERATRIGREHIGALVNTLVLAYVGASLPTMITLLQSALSTYGGMAPILNWEFVATEVIRTTVGAMGLVLTIPITTRIAVWMLVPERATADESTLAKERQATEHVGHLHASGDGHDASLRPYGFSSVRLKAYMQRLMSLLERR